MHPIKDLIKYMNRTILLSVTLVFCCVVGCRVKVDRSQQYSKGCEMEEIIEKVKGQMQPLDGCDGKDHPDSVRRYFQYYGLDVEDGRVQHLFGTFESDGQRLVGHIYKPAEYKATVILLHGYLNHTGQMKHLIKYLLRQDCAHGADAMQVCFRPLDLHDQVALEGLGHNDDVRQAAVQAVEAVIELRQQQPVGSRGHALLA